MPEAPLWQVDAFADAPFSGNPAAVVLLDAERDGAWMQAVAAEMNLSETAFLNKVTDEDYALRWFTPTTEVPLCGHATLAAAWVLFEEVGVAPRRLRMQTLSGPLAVERREEEISMSLPALPAVPCAAPAGLLAALGAERAAYVGLAREAANLLVRLPDGADLTALAPDFSALAALRLEAAGGVIVTVKGDEKFDFLSRYFAPWDGLAEDPVTGSAHCTLAPYWAGELGKSEFSARQVSRRGGVVRAALEDDRVRVGGRAVTVLRGRLL